MNWWLYWHNFHSSVCGCYEHHGELAKIIKWLKSAIYHIHWPPNTADAKPHSSLPSHPLPFLLRSHTPSISPWPSLFQENLPESVFHQTAESTALTSALGLRAPPAHRVHCWDGTLKLAWSPSLPARQLKLTSISTRCVLFTLFIRKQKHWDLLPSSMFPQP